MKHLLRGLAALLAGLLIVSAAATDAVPRSRMQVLEELTASHPEGTLAVAYYEPDTGAAYDSGAEQLLNVGDAYLLPLHLSLYAMQASDALDAGTQLSGGTVAQLQTQSLQQHDPLVTETLLGCFGSFRDYKTVQWERYGSGPAPDERYYTENGYTCAMLLQALKTLYTGDYAPLREALEQSQPGQGLAAGAGETPVAHCCGTTETGAADAAIVYASEPFLLAVCTDGIDDPEALMRQLCADLLAADTPSQPDESQDDVQKPAPDETQNDAPDETPADTPQPSGTGLRWYAWVGIGFGALILLLGALELRAVILRRRYRAARLARQQARRAAQQAAREAAEREQQAAQAQQSKEQEQPANP